MAAHAIVAALGKAAAHGIAAVLRSAAQQGTAAAHGIVAADGCVAALGIVAAYGISPPPMGSPHSRGKLDVCISADADLRREQQLVGERMALIADDVRLVRKAHDNLEKRCSLALEENDELRTLVGSLHEDVAAFFCGTSTSSLPGGRGNRAISDDQRRCAIC